MSGEVGRLLPGLAQLVGRSGGRGMSQGMFGVMWLSHVEPVLSRELPGELLEARLQNMLSKFLFCITFCAVGTI